MMLKTNKSITLTGNTTINDEQVVYYRAEISPNDSRINQSIQNQELYDANKQECRQDFTDFTKQVYEIEDQGHEE
ncbi:hypothetical protein KV134_08710 [Tetragenococcus halophilus]|uniref:hypothetical protein n=1 Tax=Tetragenococcus halophilus TaxID=51669 RepID=UPI00077C3A3D|nr:hypothetical protein [Tetragenococcus halophilus]QXN86280.1 hypothetical protein KV134_08710 [Tetragenococcus halophilus]